MIAESVSYLQERIGRTPDVAVVLGSGLGAFAEALSNSVEISYSQIPHFAVSTAVGHAGKLIVGDLLTEQGGAVRVAVMSGRAHLYEGYTAQQSIYGVRTLGKLGIKTFVLTNAAGAINTQFLPGSLVLIADHINLQGTNPLVGPNDESFGPRFPDMTEAYSIPFREIARQAAYELGFRLPEGVYAGLLGPTYETPAEIRFLRTIGADLVGMSTVAETIAVNHMGGRVLGLSCVTNMAAGTLPRKLDHNEVLEMGRAVQAQLVQLLTKTLPRLLG